MASSKRKNVLTTGQVANICNVAPRTVSKWFDSGQLRGYRIPGSKDRRIPADQLLRFMKSHGIPTDGLDLGITGVLIVDNDRELGNVLCEALNAEGKFDASHVDSAFEAGVQVANLRPAVIIVDISVSDVDPRSICRTLRAHESLSNIRLIGVSGGMTEGQGQGLLEDGFAGYVCKPFDVRQLVEAIEKASEE